MSYATTDDLKTRLARELRYLLADDDYDAVDDEDVLQALLDDATAQIDHALAARFQTPLTGDAATVAQRWCVDLAVELLFLRRRETLPAGHAERAALTRRAIAAVADGLVGLRAAQPRPADSDLLADITLDADDRVFDADELDLF